MGSKTLSYSFSLDLKINIFRAAGAIFKNLMRSDISRRRGGKSECKNTIQSFAWLLLMGKEHINAVKLFYIVSTPHTANNQRFTWLQTRQTTTPTQFCPENCHMYYLHFSLGATYDEPDFIWSTWICRRSKSRLQKYTIRLIQSLIAKYLSLQLPREHACTVYIHFTYLPPRLSQQASDTVASAEDLSNR